VSSEGYPSQVQSVMAKLPLVTGLFWVMKILATTVGETGGDVIGQTLNLGYLAGVGIFVGFLVIVLILQLAVTEFHPVLFWSVIVATSLVGTEISDYINDTLNLGYGTGSLILTTCLILVLIVWRLVGDTMHVERIRARKDELMYWIATIISNTLGTSTGDYLAHDKNGLGVGYLVSTVIISAALLMLLAAHYLTALSGTVLFWAAYVLTRPLGANAGNSLSKAHEQGGFGIGTIGASIVLLVPLVVCVCYQVRTHRRQTTVLVDDKTDEGRTVLGDRAR
jgi:uncharacterized membrane-anchored protein